MHFEVNFQLLMCGIDAATTHRGILKARSKTPKEFLYLETGAVPLRWIIAQRRINYMNHILQRIDNEFVKKVLLAQKNPVQGDFVKLVEKDLEDLP